MREATGFLCIIIFAAFGFELAGLAGWAWLITFGMLVVLHDKLLEWTEYDWDLYDYGKEVGRSEKK